MSRVSSRIKGWYRWQL